MTDTPQGGPVSKETAPPPTTPLKSSEQREVKPPNPQETPKEEGLPSHGWKHTQRSAG